MIFREKLLQHNLYLKGKFPFVDNRAAETCQHPECNTQPPILMYCFPLPGAPIPSPSCCPFAGTARCPGNARGWDQWGTEQAGGQAVVGRWAEAPQEGGGGGREGGYVAGLKQVPASWTSQKGVWAPGCLYHWAEVLAQDRPPEIEWESWVVFPGERFERDGLAGFDYSCKLSWRKVKEFLSAGSQTQTTRIPFALCCSRCPYRSHIMYSSL